MATESLQTFYEEVEEMMGSRDIGKVYIVNSDEFAESFVSII